MKIYKKDSKGKIRVLDIWAANGELIQESGLIDGKLTRASKACKPKNVGKANETTSEEQAIKQADALLKKKLARGYFVTIGEAETKEVLLPMLAKSYNDEKKKINWNEPVYVQPKLDGMRCLGHFDEMLSREGQKIETLKHIQSDIKKFAMDHYFDGEAYAHQKTFQENMSLIKKYRAGETESVKYHVYDMVIANLPFSERYAILKSLVTATETNHIKLVPTYEIKSEEELKDYHSKFLKDGFEGTIVRHGDAHYKIDGRSSNLLKYKDFKDMKSKVIDVVPSEARPEQGVIVCDGFRASLKFSHKERAEILQNKDQYIGQMAEIRYFEETDEGQPRFPVCFGFRLD